MPDIASPQTVVTRFAPSPTGFLHLGHAHAALYAWRAARDAGGRFLLRIEDIDAARCRQDYDDAIFEDLAWLGLDWETPVMRQRERREAYAGALARLREMGLLYPCYCSRKEIRAEVARAGAAPHGPAGPPYPGTCRGLNDSERAAHESEGRVPALRLDVAAAHARVGFPAWHDRRHGWATADLRPLGDVVMARKEIGTSYHIAVTVDDAAQGVTLVTRGEDLLDSTPVHRVLQALLDLPVPEWHHHGLLTDETGQRLAKRDDARSLRSLREAGHSPAEVRAMAGFPDDGA
jgi:glutamyl-Q tRNA(Asp) synthetase